MDVVINIANNSIPRSKPNTKKHNTIWCNEDCKAAIKTRNKAPKRVQKQPTQHNIENYRVIRAKTRRVIKTSKCHSWQTYVSKINSRTSIKKVSSMVHKIAGKSPSCNIKHLYTNNTEITEIPDIGNSLGQTFSNNSSSNNSRLSEIRLKTSSSDLNPIIWRRRYNSPFSVDELWDAIS